MRSLLFKTYRLLVAEYQYMVAYINCCLGGLWKFLECPLMLRNLSSLAELNGMRELGEQNVQGEL